MRPLLLTSSLLALLATVVSATEPAPRVTGELRQWHKVTVELSGPEAAERGTPNPFLDYAFEVTFRHDSGGAGVRVPGYFAADGDAAETSATAGRIWRAHFAPDRIGRWHYTVHFRHGPGVAVDGPGEPLAPYDGQTGTFTVAPTDKTGRDFRAEGRLEYVGGRYLRFAGSGRYFLKAGPDSPETLLAYADFDDTEARKPNAPLKRWQAHVRDWREGDPSWQGGRGRGLIGGLNYLASEGLNTVSFLPYNAGGDGDNVWPFIARDEKLRYDCSKLDQWGIVFDHAQRVGLHLHFKLQETEIDDRRLGAERTPADVPEALDGGRLGPERRLYLRELVARFGHALALNWNLGEENTQTSDEQRAMARYLRKLHHYPSNIVLHTFPPEQTRVYEPLLGPNSPLTGVSVQSHWAETHEWTHHWVTASRAAGRPWVVAADEQGHWGYGVPPDPGYAGFSGTADDGRRPYTLHDVRKLVLWGNLMAGGAGVEYYFGYRLPQQDIDAEDWRSRDRTWDYCRIALNFFAEHAVPFWTMSNADERVGNAIRAEARYCLAAPGDLYLVYLPWGGSATLDLTDATGTFTVQWFNPRTGGALSTGTVAQVAGGDHARLGDPPADPEEDWLILVRREETRSSRGRRGLPAGRPAAGGGGPPHRLTGAAAPATSVRAAFSPQPLTAPTVSPDTKNRWPTRNRAMSGSRIISAAAISRCHSVP